MHRNRHACGGVFASKLQNKLATRNVLRDLKKLGKKLAAKGVRFSPHTLRHTSADSYLRNGGNIEYLRRILGHSSILTTQKYLKSLGIEDLQAVHNNHSPLSRN